MEWKEIITKIKENLQWVAVGLIVAVLGLLVFGVKPASHFLALSLQAVIGVIEAYLIYNGQATITNFYIPILPKRIDWPIAIAVPVILIIKAALMWTNKETITVWWAVSAIIESWIAAHLCSFERP